jgi:hypothetical protein
MPVYRVAVTYEYYAMADTPEEACDLADDAGGDAYLRNGALARMVDPTLKLPDDDLDLLVYGPDADITLREALQYHSQNKE